MADLPDDAPISALSIPGSHETYSKVEHSWAAHCQMMSLASQLQSGIRAFDIRLDVAGDRLRTAHSGIQFWSYFEHVLEDCVEFLEAHDTETILIRIKRNKGDPDRFVQNFDGYIDAAYEDQTYWSRWFWNPAASVFPRNPSLGEIRGRIVILQDFSHPSGRLYGLDYSAHECCSCTDLSPTACDSDAPIKIQDAYDMDTVGSMGWKWQGILLHLLRANEGDHETIYINYLSGSGGAFPYFVASGHTSPSIGADHLWTGDTAWAPHYLRARCGPFWCYYYHGMNELTYHHLQNAQPRRAGIVMADFPGPGLINELIALNDSLFYVRPPSRNRLRQNVPNPFNASTLIRFSLTGEGPYRLTIYDVAGRLVRSYSGSAGPVETSIAWNGRHQSGRAVASGVYLYSLEAGGSTSTRKMVVVR